MRPPIKMVKESPDINSILHTLSIHIDEDIVKCAPRTRASSGDASKRSSQGIDGMAPGAGLHQRSTCLPSTMVFPVNHYDKIFSIDLWQIALSLDSG